MFMRKGTGAVAEVRINRMENFVFRDVAAMRGLGYFRVHGERWSLKGVI
jgi:hypothetical protein